MKYVYLRDSAFFGQSENINDLLFLFFNYPGGSIYLWNEEGGEIHPTQRVIAKYTALISSNNPEQQPVVDGAQTL